MPADLKPEEHLRRFRELETDASTLRNVWQEIQEYVVPWREPITSSTQSGSKQTDQLQDSTAIHSLTVASAAVHSLTAPVGSKWFHFAHPDPRAMQTVDIRDGLANATNTVRSILDKSLFSQESLEIVIDLLAFGTAALFWELKVPAPGRFPRVRFRALAPGSFVIAENPDGEVDTLYRKMRMTAEQIMRQWPHTTAKPVVEAISEKKYDTRFVVTHGVFPREDADHKNDLRVTPKNRPYGSLYMLSDSGTGAHVTGNVAGVGHSEVFVLDEGGYFEFPFLVPRWFKHSSEVYGRSIAMNALPDIRTLNRAVEMRFKAWQLAIGPPFATSDRGVMGDVRLQPYGRTYTKGDPRTAISKLDVAGDFNVANFNEELTRQSIRSSFFIDQIASAQSQGLTPKSATEVSINFEMMMRILGPVSTRIQSELLKPLVEGHLRGLERFGSINLSFMGDGQDLDVQFEGPLARATNIQEVDAISRWLQLNLPMAELKPEVFDWIDFSEVGKTTAFAVGMPPAVMKDEETVASEREQQRQAQQMEQLRGTAVDAAEVINKVSPTVTGTQNGR